MTLTIGETIRKRRLAKSLSQVKLAERLGTDRHRVLLWEKDKHAPSPEFRPLLAQVLGGDEADYGPEAFEPKTMHEQIEYLQDQIVDLLKRIEKLEG